MSLIKPIVIFALVCLLSPGSANADGTFYLLRHAEKQKDGSKDPQLTKEGYQRSALLAQQLSLANITKIYSTDYQRTQQTVAPLSKLLDLSVELYDPNNLDDFAEVLKKEAGQIVIVGHSNTTPTLVALLSGVSVDEIDEREYDNLYQVVLIDNQARLSRFKIFPIEPMPFKK